MVGRGEKILLELEIDDDQQWDLCNGRKKLKIQSLVGTEKEGVPCTWLGSCYLHIKVIQVLSGQFISHCLLRALFFNLFLVSGNFTWTPLVQFILKIEILLFPTHTLLVYSKQTRVNVVNNFQTVNRIEDNKINTTVTMAMHTCKSRYSTGKDKKIKMNTVDDNKNQKT